MEVWKDIVGYEGLYQVSNKGRVKRVATENMVGTGNYAREEHLLYQCCYNGYTSVALWKNNKSQRFKVHRLVALAFIPNPENLPFINHKDETRNNNCVENLEWCTHIYNVNYGTAQERLTAKKSIPVVQKTLDGQVVKTYPSARQAERETGISNGNISNCTNGRYKATCGYIWERA